jgi:hypothetical protein
MSRTDCSRTPDDFPQPAADAVAFDCGPDLARHSKADASRFFVLSITRLQHERRSRRFRPARRGEEVRPMPQPVHSGAMAPSFRRSAACGRVRAGRRSPGGPPWWRCGRGNRDGACAQACSVGRSASRGLSPLLSGINRYPARPHCRRVSRLIGEGGRSRQCERAARTGVTAGIVILKKQ